MTKRMLPTLTLAIAAVFVVPMSVSAQSAPEGEAQVAGFEPIARNTTMGAVAEVVLNTVGSTSTTNTTSATSTTQPCGCGS